MKITAFFFFFPPLQVYMGIFSQEVIVCSLKEFEGKKKKKTFIIFPVGLLKGLATLIIHAFSCGSHLDATE